MCHSGGVTVSADVIRAVLEAGVSQGELAARAGVARETLSRWATGANEPSVESLRAVVEAAGGLLRVEIEPADRELVELARRQLALAPLDRLRALLGDEWPTCRAALAAAAALGELGVIVGPVGAALRGAPQRPHSAQVDLLVPWPDQEEAFDRLIAAGAYPDGTEQMPGAGERRERWVCSAGRLTLRSWLPAGLDIAELRDRPAPLRIAEDGIADLRIALVEDLLALAATSPWPEDLPPRPGLRAVLASGAYSSRAARATDRAAAA